jgi:conjugal transfer pilus assembly protein TraD
MPWRTAYEGYAGVAWSLGLLLILFFYTANKFPPFVCGLFAVIFSLFSISRLVQSHRVLRLRASLSGKPIETMTAADLARHASDPNKLFVGFGYDVTPVHAQRFYELKKVDYRTLLLPDWFRPFVGGSSKPQPSEEPGLSWIHGVEPDEKVLHVPLSNNRGGTLIVGGSQTGKSVFMRPAIAQAIHRGDCVILIDPKNDASLGEVCETHCELSGRRESYASFHPAFPDRGVRFDPTYNWSKPTELASRIQSIMPVDTAGSFSSFGWSAVNVVAQAMVENEDRPNLANIRRYVEAGIDDVLRDLLIRFLQTAGPADWHDKVKQFEQLAQRKQIRAPSPTTADAVLAVVTYFERVLKPTLVPGQLPQSIEAALSVFHHPREHYQKITANLLPVLSMLTSGALGKSLSPDPFDADDTRPILNLEKIVNANMVFHVCLDALPDKAVASAFGSILTADLAAVAGMRYNLGINSPRISLFIDEVEIVINEPLLQLANKGAASGLDTTAATQTLADLAARLGSQDKARMFLGNFANLYAFRSKDLITQEFVVEAFGPTFIHQPSGGYTTHVDEHMAEFSASSSRQIKETLEEIVPSDLMGKLPTLQYFASVSGGRLIKGRVAALV